MAAEVATACDCYAIVGHAFGGYVACGVAADPPPGLRAAVLIDGGFMDVRTMVAVDLPVTEGRERLVAAIEESSLHFTDWGSALRDFATAIGAEPTKAIENYVHEIFVEFDGEIHDPWAPELLADVLLGFVSDDVRPYALRVQVPTLLIGCGTSPNREVRERA